MFAHPFKRLSQLSFETLKLVSFPSRSKYQIIKCSSSVASEKIKTDVKESKQLTKNVPIAKNFFLGVIDPEILVFPELETNEELNDLKSFCEPIEKYFTTEVDSAAIDREGKIPDDTLQGIKDLGLFGQQIPQKYGGLELTATQITRIAELVSIDGGITVTLAAHQSIGLKGILLFGNDEQKQKYLPKLATGEHVACFCLTEPSSGSDAASIQTKATLSDDGKHYILNGSKIWISNGGIADIFTVFARAMVKNPKTGETENKISAFIVERDFGVTSGKPEDKLGIRGSNTAEVYFDNVHVPIENVLGNPGDGFKIAMNILNSGRFSMGSAAAGMIKRAMSWIVEHANTRKQFGFPLKDFGLIKEKFARIELIAYAMESMSYLTAGFLDRYTEPDLSLEAAMVKVFASDHGWWSINEALQIMGGAGYMKSLPYERYLRDCRILLIFEGTNEILRLYIALTGMQFAGKELKEMMRKMKDPLNNMGFIFKESFNRFSTLKSPKLKFELYNAVHPSLSKPAEELEIRLGKNKMMVEKYLSEFRSEIIHEQMALKRFADICIDMYAMIAVLGRASRAKSIGLPNCDHDILLAQTFSKQALERIDYNIDQLNKGRHENCDDSMVEIADAIFKKGGYVPSHALERNF